MKRLTVAFAMITFFNSPIFADSGRDLTVSSFIFYNHPVFPKQRMMAIEFESGERMSTLICYMNLSFAVDKNVSEYIFGKMRVAEFIGKNGKELMSIGPLRVHTEMERKMHESIIKSEREDSHCDSS